MTTDGFVRVPNWLIDDADLNAHELLVYMVLLRFRDHKTGKCHPGMTTIADRARISRRTVMRAIEGLESKQMIRVERRSTVKENKPNTYYVALATETPEHIWASSVRGRRVPKRRPTSDSESPGTEEPSPTSDSESPGSDSESPTPVTPSHPNKNQKNKNQEQAMRQEQQFPPGVQFTFGVEEKATEKQISYLSDLYIFITERIPETRTRDGWTNLDTTAASDLISTFWQQMDRGRGGMWDSPVDQTHSAYRGLSSLGKKWVINGYPPDTLEAA